MSDFELPMRPPQPAGTARRGTSLPAALALAGAAVGALAGAWLIYRALTGPGGDEGDGAPRNAVAASGAKAAAQGADTAGDTGAAAQGAGTADNAGAGATTGAGAANAAATGGAKAAGDSMARDAGAAGAQPDDPATMLGQLRSAEGAVLDELGLSADERCIGRLVMRGLTYRQIAGRVYLAERTVKYHASAEGAVLDELGLSADERCIGRLVMRGLTYRQIAGRVYLAERTVKYHARHLYAKARVGNRRAFEAYVRRRLAERADA